MLGSNFLASTVKGSGVAQFAVRRLLLLRIRCVSFGVGLQLRRGKAEGHG